MSGVGPEEPADLAEIRKVAKERVLKAIGELGQLDVQDLTQARIIAVLLTDQRTVTELVEEIYEQKRGDEGYRGAYSKTRRAVMVLASHGYVSTRLFGKDKPYRLTKYAVSNLADFRVPADKPRIIPRMDMAIHGFTISLGVIAFLLAIDKMDFGSSLPFAVFYAAFFLFLGASTIRLLESVSKVM